MKVNYISTYVNKRVKLNREETIKANYGKKLDVDKFVDIEDITGITNILFSYCHAEVNGSLIVDGCNRVLEDFNKDIEMAKETFEEEVNKLELRGISLDLREVKEALFD